MSESKKQKLESLRKNYQEVKGQPFDHFFCPILLRDQDVSLCKAHIINQAFSESTPDWTIQREDVDKFYGRVVESEFVKLDYDQTDITAEALVDSELSKKLQPKIKVGGNEVEHFILDDELPSECTAVEYEHEDQTVQLGLKIPPEKFVNEMNNVNIEINLDVRVHAFVSLLKSAHLFMFDLLGYNYIFRKTGQFLGKILQDFFIQNKDNSNEEARKNAENLFRDYFALVRPLDKESSVPPDTIDNHHFHLVWIEDTNKIWGKSFISIPGICITLYCYLF